MPFVGNTVVNRAPNASVIEFVCFKTMTKVFHPETM